MRPFTCFKSFSIALVACLLIGATGQASATTMTDPTYGTGGTTILPKLVWAQPSTDGTVTYLDSDGLHRLSTSGSADATFGSGGTAAGSTGASSAEVLADGGIVLGGPGLTVHRYLPNGAPDPTFATGGAATLATPACTYDSTALVQLTIRAVQGDRTIVAFTFRTTPPPASKVPPTTFVRFQRILTDGTIDPVQPAAVGFDTCTATDATPVSGPNNQLLVKRTTSLSSFATATAPTWTWSAPTGSTIAAVDVRSPARIVIAYAKNAAPTMLMNVCLDAVTGLPDTTCTDTAGQTSSIVADGSNVVVGVDGRAGERGALITRWTPAGTLDTSFGPRGSIVACFPASANLTFGTWHAQSTPVGLLLVHVRAGDTGVATRLAPSSAAIPGPVTLGLTDLYRRVYLNRLAESSMRARDCNGASITTYSVRWLGRTYRIPSASQPFLPLLREGAGRAYLTARDAVGRAATRSIPLVVDRHAPAARASIFGRRVSLYIVDRPAGPVARPTLLALPSTSACRTRELAIADRAGNARFWRLTVRSGRIVGFAPSDWALPAARDTGWRACA